MPVWQIILLVSALLFAALSVFLWVWNIVRAKKMREQGFVTTKTKAKKVKLPFKLDKFINSLGGIDNIVKTSASKSKLKVYVVDDTKIDFDELKKIKNHGIFNQSDNVSIVLGSHAAEISGMINDLITLNTTDNTERDMTIDINKKAS